MTGVAPAVHGPVARTPRGVGATNGCVGIDYRERLPTRRRGSLLQAGPLLVRDGRSAIEGMNDPEGFAATAHEFDEELTANREPRLAIARTTEGVLAVAADGSWHR